MAVGGWRSMRGWGVGLLAAWATLCLPAAATACTRLVATGNPEYPPYLWRDPQDGSRLVGANAELMQLLAREVGLPIEVRYAGSWARVQEEMRQGRVDLIAGAFFTVPRLDYMDYVYPAFHMARSVVWSRQARPVGYQRWQDLRGAAGLTVVNNSFGEEFDRYAQEALRLSAVPSLEDALRQVERGSADYLIYEEGPAQAFIARLGVSGLAAEPGAVSHEALYLTLSHKSACNTPELRARLARAMYKVDRQNLMKRLVDAGVQAWRTSR